MPNNMKTIVEPADEDTIQCLFFSTELGSDTTLWEELCNQLNNSIAVLAKDYIWQRDEFKVFIPISDPQRGVPIHLCSNTCFGDNIEDEWFIVHIVLELSRQYQTLIIQVTDNDGDFLLIEAADHLQTWANPESTVNRVFIHNSHIHIITPKTSTLDEKLDLEAAVKIIKASPQSTQVSREIEQAIYNRIGKYPDKLIDDTHNTAVKLPCNLAALLILKPSLIAPLVNAYCNHDLIDAKCCKNIDFTDCVTIKVKFTKFLFATLMHSKLINNGKHYTYKNDKNSMLGLKLTCGYQMIMNRGSTDLFSSKDYHKFLDSLKQNGYFKNNLEGSQEYNQLLKKAKEYFSIAECPVTSHLSHSIEQLQSSSEYIRIKDTLKEKYIIEPGYTGDNEDWLNIHPEELNDLLLTRYGKTSKFKSNDVISSGAVTTELSAFLKQTSDFEGIEPDRNVDSGDENVEFESDQFVACVEKMLNLLSTGGDVNDESEDSDEDYDIMGDEDDINICDKELKAKLHVDNAIDIQDNNTILTNIIQSMREEKASAGPTSNLMRSIGVHKSELLDSDDDDDES